MRRAWLPLLAAPLVSAALAACAGVAVTANTAVPGHSLTVYSSLPLSGDEAAAGLQMLRGEKLALADAGGHVDRYSVSLFALNDASAESGRWEPGLTATNAELAAQDKQAIAYIGDLTSGATAVSLPLTNGAGIPQISPGSSYGGLTSPFQAGQGDPQRFYPAASMTFARLIPGDYSEAQAQVAMMRALAIHSVFVLASEDGLQGTLAAELQEDAQAAGITVAGSERLDLAGNLEARALAGLMQKIQISGAQAVFFSGGQEPGVTGLFSALHRAAPGMRLLASHQLDSEVFVRQLGAAAGNLYIGTPWLADDSYSGAAQGVLRRYAETFGEAAQPYALFGYAAMRLALAAIRAAGSHAGDRASVVAQLYALREAGSPLGSFSILPDGESTLSRYGIAALRSGRLTLLRTFHTALPAQVMLAAPEGASPAAAGNAP